MANDPVALDYAPPEEGKRWRVLRLLLILSAVHFGISMLFAVVWDEYPGPFLEVVAIITLFPFFTAYKLEWMRGAIPLALIPLNSLLYGLVLTAIVLIVRRLMFRQT